MTTQHDELAMLIERLTFLANSDSGLSVIAQDTCRKAAALLAADAQAGWEAIEKFEQEDVEAVAARLGDDAAQLRQENDDDERAENMDRAATMLTWMLLTHPLYTHPQPQAEPQAEPRGWKLVPVRPTRAMDEAGYATLPQRQRHLGYDLFRVYYRAMLDASPAAPAAAQDIDWLPHDDTLRFVQRVLESDAPKADRNSAAKMVRDMRLSIRPAAAQVAQPLTEIAEMIREAHDLSLDEMHRFAREKMLEAAALLDGIGKDQG